MTGIVRLRLNGERGDIATVLASLVGLEEYRLVVEERVDGTWRETAIQAHADLLLPTAAARSGFVAETFIVVHCNGCSGVFGPDEATVPQVFASVDEAVAYVSDPATAAGWQFDGYQLTCDLCIAAAECALRGHVWGEWAPSIAREHRYVRMCRDCGSCEGEDRQ
ncbi:hypothetical protein AB0N05_14970 [Nocardia sp. NPDC051030]|uniref:hypothetical protein n=1 Tax=Nocardia sp. NPDC051030 TaxID=3155162 RepID=UPI0034388C4F